MNYYNEIFEESIFTSKAIENDELYRYFALRDIDTQKKLSEIKEHLLYSLSISNEYNLEKVASIFNEIYDITQLNLSKDHFDEPIKVLAFSSDIISYKNNMVIFSDFFLLGYTRLRFLKSLNKRGQLNLIPPINISKNK